MVRKLFSLSEYEIIRPHNLKLSFWETSLKYNVQLLLLKQSYFGYSHACQSNAYRHGLCENKLTLALYIDYLSSRVNKIYFEHFFLMTANIDFDFSNFSAPYRKLNNPTSKVMQQLSIVHFLNSKRKKAGFKQLFLEQFHFIFLKIQKALFKLHICSHTSKTFNIQTTGSTLAHCS